jgi:hypothetical protein
MGRDPSLVISLRFSLHHNSFQSGGSVLDCIVKLRDTMVYRGRVVTLLLD